VREVSGQEVGHEVLDVLLFSDEVDDSSLTDVERGFDATMILAERSREKSYHFQFVL
jgi:hypothetical protein